MKYRLAKIYSVSCCNLFEQIIDSFNWRTDFIIFTCSAYIFIHFNIYHERIISMSYQIIFS